MNVSVTCYLPITDFWADEATLANMSDSEIIALVREDLVQFACDGTWSVSRESSEARLFIDGEPIKPMEERL